MIGRDTRVLHKLQYQDGRIEPRARHVALLIAYSNDQSAIEGRCDQTYSRYSERERLILKKCTLARCVYVGVCVCVCACVCVFSSLRENRNRFDRKKYYIIAGWRDSAVGALALMN